MSKYNPSIYNSSAILGGTGASQISQNQAFFGTERNDGRGGDYPMTVEEQQRALDAKMQQIASEPGNLALGVGRAIGTLFNSFNGVLTRLGEYIPTFPPVAEGASAGSKKTATKKKKMSFNKFFEKYAEDKVEVTLDGKVVDKDTTEGSIREFRDMCKLAVDNGDSQMVKYFLKHVDGIKIEVGDVKSQVAGLYSMKDNIMLFYAKPGQFSYTVPVFLHEATHFVQVATRSFVSQGFLDDCYETMERVSKGADDCIVGKIKCDDLEQRANMTSYRGPVVFNHPGVNKDNYYPEGRGENLITSYNDLGGDSYRKKLLYVKMVDGKYRVPSKKEEMLYDLYSNIHDTLSSYRRMIAREGENSLTHDLFQDSLDKEGLDFLEKVISGDQTHSVGIGADSNLRRKAILLHVLYISNLLYEKEAYLKSAVSSDVVRDECGIPEVEWLDAQLSLINEITKSPVIVTRDALQRLESMGVKCKSSKIIPPYKGRIVGLESRVFSSESVESAKGRLPSFGREELSLNGKVRELYKMAASDVKSDPISSGKIESPDGPKVKKKRLPKRDLSKMKGVSEYLLEQKSKIDHQKGVISGFLDKVTGVTDRSKMLSGDNPDIGPFLEMEIILKDYSDKSGRIAGILKESSGKFSADEISNTRSFVDNMRDVHDMNLAFVKILQEGLVNTFDFPSRDTKPLSSKKLQGRQRDGRDDL